MDVVWDSIACNYDANDINECELDENVLADIKHIDLTGAGDRIFWWYYIRY